MSIWAVIPARPPAEGKSRLAGALSDEARVRFNERCFRHTLTVVASAIGPARTLVVSRFSAWLDVAKAVGAESLLETEPGGLNQALAQAADLLGTRAATGILSVSCDLPFLSEDDVRAMLDEAEAGTLVIAGDRAEQGTNALIVSPVDAIPYRYGLGSFHRHLDEADRAGLKVRHVNRIGLAFDVDTPADLDQMRTIAQNIAARDPIQAVPHLAG